MNEDGQPSGYRRYRAPDADGAAWIEPPLTDVARLIADNLACIARAEDYHLQGRSLGTLRSQARDELVRAALTYTRQYRDVSSVDSGSPILLAGHQPLMFHPGVWCKNFALAGLAQQHSAVGINLVIDNDTLKAPAIGVPSGSISEPVLHQVAFDAATLPMPFEERAITDRPLFESFGNRVTDAVSSLVPHPLMERYWPLVEQRAKSGVLLGESLAQGRHLLEGAWGISTLEVPLSHVLRLESFGWFVAHLLAELPRLWQTYNAVLKDFRRANQIRSANHPVPDLAADGDWLEAPFWIWNVKAPRRRRLFARGAAGQVVLSDRDQFELSLPLSSDGAAAAVEQLRVLEARGVKIRTRALTTTWFSRLFLGDVFLHGIGGAKYDELTDQLMRRFMGIEPPRYMVLSATLRLPIARAQVTPADLRGVQATLREMTYHPERFLGAGHDPQSAQLAAEKEKWIAMTPTRENARQRCHAIRQINEQLQQSLSILRSRRQWEQQQLERSLRAQRLLAARDYAFALYPEETLRDFLLEFLSDNA